MYDVGALFYNNKTIGINQSKAVEGWRISIKKLTQLTQFLILMDVLSIKQELLYKSISKLDWLSLNGAGLLTNQKRKRLNHTFYWG